MAVDSHDIGGLNPNQGELMNAEIQGKIDAIKAPFQGMIDAADAIPALVDAAELAKFNEGFVSGQASIVLPSPDSPDVVYTQADMDKLAEIVRAENVEALAAKDVELAGLGEKLVTLQAEVDGLPQVLADAVTTAKSEFLAKLEAVEVDNQALIAELKV